PAAVPRHNGEARIKVLDAVGGEAHPVIRQDSPAIAKLAGPAAGNDPPQGCISRSPLTGVDDPRLEGKTVPHIEGVVASGGGRCTGRLLIKLCRRIRVAIDRAGRAVDDAPTVNAVTEVSRRVRGSHGGTGISQTPVTDRPVLENKGRIARVSPGAGRC